MAQAKMAANKEKVAPEEKAPQEVTGNLMPTPEEMPRVRKPSLSTLVFTPNN